MKYGWNPWAPQVWAVTCEEYSDPSLPMISIGVLTCNRCEDLRRTLDVLSKAVRYPNYEIIVIDNGSTDGTVEMIRSEYPAVRIHETGGNYGVSSRNIQSRIARGKYLFSYDDDSIPATPSTVLRIVRQMESYSIIDALGTTLYRPASGVTETNGWEVFRLRAIEKTRGLEGMCIAEGASCFRVDRLRDIQGYDKRIFWGSEAVDLVLQLYQRQSLTFLCPWFGTLHFPATSMRLEVKRPYINSRNPAWIIAKHWPLPAAVLLLILHGLRRGLVMAMHSRTALDNLRGLRDAMKGILPFLKHRPKLNWKQVFTLGRFYYCIFRW